MAQSLGQHRTQQMCNKFCRIKCGFALVEFEAKTADAHVIELSTVLQPRNSVPESRSKRARPGTWHTGAVQFRGFPTHIGLHVCTPLFENTPGSWYYSALVRNTFLSSM